MIRPHLPRNVRTAVQKVEGGRTATEAASKSVSLTLPVRGAGRPEGRPAYANWCVLAGLCLDDLVERQLAVIDLVDAVIGQAGVAVLVDRVGAEDAVAILRVEDRVHDG